MRTNLQPFAMVPDDLIAAVKPRALQVWCSLVQWTEAGERSVQPTITRIAGNLGISRDVVERSLNELEATGRLIRSSGKAAGQRNQYTLILTRLDAETGCRSSAAGVPQNSGTHIKEVKKLSLRTPLPPQKRGTRRAQNPTAETATDTAPGWRDFWEAYPNKRAQARALGAWAKIDPADHAEAIAGAQLLARLADAASPARRQYIMQAWRWLAEKGWTDDLESLETFFNIPGHTAAQQAQARARAADDNNRNYLQRLLAGKPDHSKPEPRT